MFNKAKDDTIVDPSKQVTNNDHRDQEAEQSHHTDIEELTREKTEVFFEANAGDGTTCFDQYKTGLPFYVCLLSCFLCVFLIGLDQTIVSPLYSQIGNKFSAFNEIGWLVSAYMLAMCVLAPTWGRISILYGRKSSMLVSIIIFLIGSLICALANSMNMLIGGRVICGIGGGGIQTMSFIIATELAPISMRPITLATVSLGFSISGVVGPLIGGAFASNVTWRWAFYLNLPVGGFSAIVFFIFLHPPSPKFTIWQKVSQLDYIGTALCSASLTLFLLAISFGGNNFPWKSGAVISCFVLFFVVGVVFCIWNFKYSKWPLIPWFIIREIKLDIPVMCMFVIFFGFMCVIIYLSSFFQVVHNASPIGTGVRLLPFIISVGVASISTGTLMKVTRYIKPFSVAAAILCSVGCGCLAILDQDTSTAVECGLLIIPGVGVGIFMQSVFISCQLEAPKEEGSTILVTSFFNFARAFAGALGSNLGQTTFNASYKTKINSLYESNSSAFANYTKSYLNDLMNEPSEIADMSGEAKTLVLDAAVGAFRNVFYLSCSLFCVSVVLTACFSNQRLPKDSQVAKKEDLERLKGDTAEENQAENQELESQNNQENESHEEVHSGTTPSKSPISN